MIADQVARIYPEPFVKALTAAALVVNAAKKIWLIDSVTDQLAELGHCRPRSANTIPARHQTALGRLQFDATGGEID